MSKELPLILMVEADESLAWIVASSLSRDGYRVLSCGRLADALDTLEADSDPQPALVILDIDSLDAGDIVDLVRQDGTGGETALGAEAEWTDRTTTDRHLPAARIEGCRRHGSARFGRCKLSHRPAPTPGPDPRCPRQPAAGGCPAPRDSAGGGRPATDSFSTAVGPPHPLPVDARVKRLLSHPLLLLATDPLPSTWPRRDGDPPVLCKPFAISDLRRLIAAKAHPATGARR
jgi:CheY-like chemotaxis protein